MKTEFTIDQIKNFVAKGYQSVSARMTKSLLEHYNASQDGWVSVEEIGGNIQDAAFHELDENTVMWRGANVILSEHYERISENIAEIAAQAIASLYESGESPTQAERREEG